MKETVHFHFAHFLMATFPCYSLLASVDKMGIKDTRPHRHAPPGPAPSHFTFSVTRVVPRHLTCLVVSRVPLLPSLLHFLVSSLPPSLPFPVSVLQPFLSSLSLSLPCLLIPAFPPPSLVCLKCYPPQSINFSSPEDGKNRYVSCCC